MAMVQFSTILLAVGRYMDPVTDAELSDMAEHVTPTAHERIATILGMDLDVVANLRGAYREDMHGISLGILKMWCNIHHKPGNRIVSLGIHPSVFHLIKYAQYSG